MRYINVTILLDLMNMLLSSIACSVDSIYVLSWKNYQNCSK